MLNFEAIRFDYDPYPIGIARRVIDLERYREMVDTLPDDGLFVTKENLGTKLSLSQLNNRAGYLAHIRNHRVWQRFYDYIKSERFIAETMAMLKEHGIDLGLANLGLRDRMARRVRALKRGSPQPHFPKLRSRFEFSSMPVTGGSIRPHTDAVSKAVTMVIPMLRENEWQDSYGGGTSVVKPKDIRHSFNRVNNYLDFDEVDCLKTFPFEPNQCLVFVKTYNSWHAVWPMTGDDPNTLRRTLTINIETD